MHHFALRQKAKLENGSIGLGREEELPVCPKPRRVGPAVPEFLYPLRCKHSHSSHGGSSEVLDMIASKNQDGGRESISTGCSPSCYCGSPPSRSGNPLVHDVQFIRQMEILPQYPRTKLSDRLSFTSAT